MGPLAVRMNGALTLSACPSGLRIGIMRILGPFSSNLFVPWTEIHAERGKAFFIRSVTLEFGSPMVGTLGMRAHVADRLARAAGARWPEPGAIPPETKGRIFRSIVKEWAITTAFAAAFFIIA